ncbi:hypothetical protein ACWTQY_31520, partial [Klebsiella pneumoniae]
AGTTQDLEFLVPEVLDAGSVLEFCMRRYGMKIEVQLEVVELIDQQRIFLQQTKGPFQRWFHEYSFMSVDDNRTKLTERIFFEPPSGFLGIFITGTG